MTVVAPFGCVSFFARDQDPQLGTLHESSQLISFILIGTVLCIANTIVANGVSEWFVNYVLPSSLSFSLMGGVFLVSVMCFVIMLIVPVAPALIGVLTIAIISLAATTGINPALLIALLMCRKLLFVSD